MTIIDAYQNSITCSSPLMASEVKLTFTTNWWTARNLCKIGIFGKSCQDLPVTIIEDPYSNQGVTTNFDLLLDTTKNIVLPTLNITPTGCVDTTWTVHLQSDNTNMVTAKPTIFAINDPNLTLTHTISDFAQRKSLFGS